MHHRRRTTQPALIIALATTMLILTTAPGTAAGDAGWLLVDSGVTHDLNGAFWEPETVYCFAVGDLGTILRSEQGGDWLPRSSGVTENLRAVSFGSAQKGVAVGTGGTLLWTDDAGADWNIAQTGFIGTYHGAHMFDEDLAYACGVNAIFQPIVAKSTDGGQNWTFKTFYINSSEGTLTDIHFTDTMTGFACARIFDGSGAIVRTTDGGQSWTPVFTHAQAINALDFPTQQVGMAAATGLVFRTEDGGESWAIQSTGSAVNLWGIDFVDPLVGTVTGDEGMIRRTTNGGLEWSDQESGTTFDLFDVQFVDALNGLVVGEGGVILRTETGGDSPSSAPDGTPGAIRLATHPNPSRGDVAITFDADGARDVRLAIYDAAGRRIRLLAHGDAPSETRTIAWDGRDDGGRRTARGTYFVRLTGRITEDRLIDRTARFVRTGR